MSANTITALACFAIGVVVIYVAMMFITRFVTDPKRKGLASLQALERLVGRAGIEPATHGLRVRCSTS